MIPETSVDEPSNVVSVIVAARESTEKIRGLRNACAANIETFATVHMQALRNASVIDVTPLTNCAVHVSIVGRDLANFELCILDSWTDYEITPTLIAHFYLATYEFMNRWPQILFERPTKKCLRLVRSDGFDAEVRALNSDFQVVRDDWWPKLHAVRTNYAAHYDRDSSKLVETLGQIDFQSFLALAKPVNDLLTRTAQTLTLISDEMSQILKKIERS